MGFIIFSVIFLSIVAWNSCWFISFATHHSSYEGFLLFIVEFIALPIIAVLGCFFGWNFAKKCHKKRHKLAAVLSGFALFTCLVAVPMMFVIPGGLTFEQGVLAFFGRVLVCTPELLPAYLFATLYYYKNRKKKDETSRQTRSISITFFCIDDMTNPPLPVGNYYTHVFGSSQFPIILFPEYPMP